MGAIGGAATATTAGTLRAAGAGSVRGQAGTDGAAP